MRSGRALRHFDQMMGTPPIFIEGLALIDDHFSGIGQYTLGILRGMDALAQEAVSRGESPLQVRVIVPYDRIARFEQFRFRHLSACSLPTPHSLLVQLLYSGKMFALDTYCGKGSYLFPRFVSTPLRNSPSAAVIHDLSYELYRQYCDDANANFLSQYVRKTVAQVDHVFTISENSKREIVDFYGISPQDLSIAPPAADPDHFYRRTPGEIASVRRKYDIQDDYILALSNLEPRKNLETLVDVYCDLPREVSDRVALLLVGSLGWKATSLIEKILTRVEQGFNITRPASYVLDEDRPAIFSGAEMLVFPSHYEGFGMPPLEALACGTPVIAADNSSLPEVVGAAGRLVPSRDPEAIGAAVVDLFSSLAEETERTKLEGPRQATRFCWTKSAKIILDQLVELGSRL